MTITTVDNEVLYGSARIEATQGLDGSGELSLAVCGTNGTQDFWWLTVGASSTVSADAQSPLPLPLSQGDAIDFPIANADVRGVLHDGNVGAELFDGQLVASHGQLQGSVTWGDAGATATFAGQYAFTCQTNHPDPDFKTTFCQQFIALAPP